MTKNLKHYLIVIGIFFTCLFTLTATLHYFREERAKNTKWLGSTKSEYEITHVNPPKHVYVDLKETSTGKVYSHIYVSKHMNDWREKLWVGRKITLTRDDFNYYGESSPEFSSIRKAVE